MSDRDDFQQETLESKVHDVVKNNGNNVLFQNRSVRGSIIHLRVEFDEHRPILLLTAMEMTVTRCMSIRLLWNLKATALT